MYACWATLQGWLLKHSFSQLLWSLMYIKTAILFQSLSQQRSDSSKPKWRGSFLIFSFPFNNAHQFPLPFSIPNLLPVHNPQQPISLINISGYLFHMSSDHHGRPVLRSIKRNGRCKPILLSCNETESKNVRHQCAGTNDFQYCVICWRIFVAEHFVGVCNFLKPFFSCLIALYSCTTVILQFSRHFSCLPVIKLLIF